MDKIIGNLCKGLSFFLIRIVEFKPCESFSQDFIGLIYHQKFYIQNRLPIWWIMLYLKKMRFHLFS